MAQTALLVSASAQRENSLSRKLAGLLVQHLAEKGDVDTVIERDLSSNDMHFVTQDSIAAYYTPQEQRDAAQKELLRQSDVLVAELKQADILVVATPMYNFSVPAVLKAWIDLVCRAGETFRYTAEGPVGLSGIRKAYLVVATGGAAVEGSADFVVPYLKHVLRFLGVPEIEVVAADRVNAQREQAIAAAQAKIAAA
jgi:FMN-dependent NADH-azoreductase